MKDGLYRSPFCLLRITNFAKILLNFNKKFKNLGNFLLTYGIKIYIIDRY